MPIDSLRRFSHARRPANGRERVEVRACVPGDGGLEAWRACLACLACVKLLLLARPDLLPPTAYVQVNPHVVHAHVQTERRYSLCTVPRRVPFGERDVCPSKYACLRKSSNSLEICSCVAGGLLGCLVACLLACLLRKCTAYLDGGYVVRSIGRNSLHPHQPRAHKQNAYTCAAVGTSRSVRILR